MTNAACVCCGLPTGECQCWEFPGWGKVERITDLGTEAAQSETDSPTQQTSVSSGKKLGQWRATAICGNDITSSCLYVSALAALYAGPLAPIALLMVAGILYLFQRIYSEVGSALPFNGGAYSLLLNTTTKWRAAAAACLTLLSYVATAVISASEAIHYAADFAPSIDILMATAVLLGLFAVLTFLGISDSANVALAIFVFHMLTLLTLVLLAGAALIVAPSTLLVNLGTPVDQWPTIRSGPFPLLLFFGFSAAMLRISGFESSANYLEEQRPGVFPLTLRNMWIAVAIFNPLISFLSLAVFPLGEIREYKETLLSEMGHHSMLRLGGMPSDALLPRLIGNWISFDAFIVLSGAVLTSYVGVMGLVRRMSMDNCLPQFLLRTNRWRGTTHWIVVGFFLLCCSILLVTQGQIEMLAGVYTLSFLAVMGLFAVGNLMLKQRHPGLKRDSVASIPRVILALVAIVAAAIGNVVLNPEYVRVFAGYFAAAAGVVAFIFYRTMLLKFLLRSLNHFFAVRPFQRLKMRSRIVSLLHDLECRSLIVVTSRANPSELRRVAEYVRRNEPFRFMKVALFSTDQATLTSDIAALHRELDHSFPDIHIDLLGIEADVTPEAVAGLRDRLGTPKNYVFVTPATAQAVGDLSQFGGVRIIA